MSIKMYFKKFIRVSLNELNFAFAVGRKFPLDLLPGRHLCKSIHMVKSEIISFSGSSCGL